MREAPSITIARELKARGATTKACDPEALGTGKAEIGDNIDAYLDDMYEVAEGTDVVIVCTEWNEYRELDPTTLTDKVRTAAIIDGRNVLDPQRWRSAGWTYRALGRPTA